MRFIKYGLIALVMSVTPPVFAEQAGNSDIIKGYLDTVSPDYPEGMAKITYNCNTNEVVLRGHGLAAGLSYELRSGGAFEDVMDVTAVAVGKGISGLGNNVLIKGEIEPYLSQPGDYWNLWELPDPEDLDGKAIRVLRGVRTPCWDDE